MFCEGREFTGRRRSVEPAEAYVDRMNRSATDHVENRVPRLFQRKPTFDVGTRDTGKFDRVGRAQEIRGVQQVDMQCVTGDPLAAIQKSSQIENRLGEVRTACLLDRVAGADLVSDRADSANPGRDVGRLAEIAAPDK